MLLKEATAFLVVSAPRHCADVRSVSGSAYSLTKDAPSTCPQGKRPTVGLQQWSRRPSEDGNYVIILHTLLIQLAPDFHSPLCCISDGLHLHAMPVCTNSRCPVLPYTIHRQACRKSNNPHSGHTRGLSFFDAEPIRPEELTRLPMLFRPA